MRQLIVAAALCLLLACTSPPRAQLVRADDYDAFWLWAGVRPQPALERARSLYVLEAEIVGAEPAMLQRRLGATPRILHAESWIVYRADTLAWSPRVVPAMRADVQRWRANGNRVVGIQIDFDARTRHLERYTGFLRELRAQLPADVKLGTTGLLDWSANGDPAQLAALRGSVDEVVIQTYQGRNIIPNYSQYMPKLDTLQIPFRIGLVQGSEWLEPPGLRANPFFRGYVVFLLNPGRQSLQRG